MTTSETRNNRERRVGQTYSVYLHFDEKDALDTEAEKRGLTANALVREAVREKLGLPVA